MITVTRGSVTPAEIAVITAVLLAARARADAASASPVLPYPARPPCPARPQWAARSRARGAFPRPAPGGWRASARPH